MSSIKIVLITPFLEEIDGSNANSVIAKIKDMKIDLIVISDELEYQPPSADPSDPVRMAFSQSQAKTQSQAKSQQLIERIVTETDGVFSNFADAVLQLSYFPGTKTTSMPWYCPLTIGDDLRIHVAAYLYITRETMKSFKTESKDSGSFVKCETQYVKNGKLLPDLDLTTTIEGYVYGDRKVPYDKCLNMDYDAGGKSFMCVGFSPRRFVLDEYFEGKSTYLVVPQSTCDTSIMILNALGQTMIEKGMVMIARRVRQQREKPKMMALFPVVHTEYQTIYFHMIELIFSENRLEFFFPDLTAAKYQPTEEQIAAVDQLIDSMDLMTADDGVEAFSMDRTLNPSKQFIYRAISARAMDPGQPLPKFSEDLAKMFEMPEVVKEQSSEAVARLTELFPITVKEENKKQRWMKKNILAGDASTATTDNAGDPQVLTQGGKKVCEIGTLQPMEDFDLLYRSGEKFSDLCVQLQSVLSDLIFKSMSWVMEAEKISKAMLYYREQAKSIGSHHYNDWIVSFKTHLLIRGKVKFFNEIIVKEQLGIITADESDTSSCTIAEARDFYSTEVDAKKMDTEQISLGDDDNIFDDM